MSQWENSKRDPDCKTLIELSKFLNVSIDELLGNDNSVTIGDEKKEIVNFVLNQNITKEQFELLKMNLQLNAVNLLKATCYVAGLLTAQN